MEEYKILIVDDEEINRDILKEFLQEKFAIDIAENGAEAIDKVTQNGEQYIAMILDLQMPKKDGFDVLRVMREKNFLQSIPVLVITGEKTKNNEKQCFELGATEFIEKPFEPQIIRKRVENIVKMSMNQRFMAQKIEEQTRTLKNQYQLLCAQNEKLRISNSKIIDIMGSVVEYRHLESGQHIRRVKMLTNVLAETVMKECPEYHLTKEKVKMIVEVSPLHDLGKIAIPDKILEKPGKLTDKEFEYMKSHTVRACSLLESLYDIWDEDLRQVCYDICRHHHERYDGTGYPDGLKGEEIPLSAQIVSVADVYDALVSERVYKGAYSKDEAFYMILNGECGVFSPYIMDCFRHVKKQFEEVLEMTEEEELHDGI